MLAYAKWFFVRKYRRIRRYLVVLRRAHFFDSLQVLMINATVGQREDGGVVDAMCKISLALQIQFVSKEGCSVGRSYDRVLLGGAEGSTSEVRQRRSNSSRNLYETVCGYGTMTVVSCRPGGLPNRTPPMRAHNIYEPPPGRSSSSCPFHIPHLYLLSFPLHHF
uniref:Uncharacterized protein n=1 Tax=Wuchereria bancrofti TaxID=6293 RepID=A0A1I8EYA2_WUCBA